MRKLQRNIKSEMDRIHFPKFPVAVKSALFVLIVTIVLAAAVTLYDAGMVSLVDFVTGIRW